ncbi:MAG: hypothetical protein PF545_01950 [Elusimicrobia bacterium]|jgi:hypothetical protein|nr:hypothetical protein [Elusimicrobiota bacterium]
MLKVSRPPFKHAPGGSLHLWRSIFTGLFVVLAVNTLYTLGIVHGILPGTVSGTVAGTVPGKLKITVWIIIFFSAAVLIKSYINEDARIKDTFYRYGVWAVYTALLVDSGQSILAILILTSAALLIYEIVFASPGRFVLPPFIIVWLFLSYFSSVFGTNSGANFGIISGTQSSIINLDLATATVIYAVAAFFIFKKIVSIKDIAWYFLPALIIYLIGQSSGPIFRQNFGLSSGPNSLKLIIINLSALILLLLYPGILPEGKIWRPVFISLAVFGYFIAGITGVVAVLLFTPVTERI